MSVRVVAGEGTTMAMQRRQQGIDIRLVDAERVAYRKQARAIFWSPTSLTWA